MSRTAAYKILPEAIRLGAIEVPADAILPVNCRLWFDRMDIETIAKPGRLSEVRVHLFYKGKRVATMTTVDAFPTGLTAVDGATMSIQSQMEGTIPVTLS